eukprot:196630-Pyramimonas_sp.AAC.1
MAKRPGNRGHPWSTPRVARIGTASSASSHKRCVVVELSQACTVWNSDGALAATPSRTFFRRIELKALDASKLKTTPAGLASVSAERVLWTNSQPALLPAAYW